MQVSEAKKEAQDALFKCVGDVEIPSERVSSIMMVASWYQIHVHLPTTAYTHATSITKALY